MKPTSSTTTSSLIEVTARSIASIIEAKAGRRDILGKWTSEPARMKGSADAPWSFSSIVHSNQTTTPIPEPVPVRPRGAAVKDTLGGDDEPRPQERHGWLG